MEPGSDSDAQGGAGPAGSRIPAGVSRERALGEGVCRNDQEIPPAASLSPQFPEPNLLVCGSQ